MTYLIKYKHLIIGGISGAILGFAYYYFWGCTNGCTITSSPTISTLYGAFIGGLFISIFTKK